jgi:hypothetical protein
VGIAFRAGSYMLKKIQTCDESKPYCSSRVGVNRTDLCRQAALKRYQLELITTVSGESTQNWDILFIVYFFNQF